MLSMQRSFLTVGAPKPRLIGRGQTRLHAVARGRAHTVSWPQHRETESPHQPTSGVRFANADPANQRPNSQKAFTHVNPIVVIPARMASTRLPGKPLAEINGKPMIVMMLEHGLAADIGPVAVACGDPEIAASVRAAGGRAVLTDPALPSGSDRVHAALAELDPDGTHDVVVNLQGDFPTLDPASLKLVILPLADPAVDIGTLVVPIRDEVEANTASFVKAACAFEDGERIAPALYFSRQPIPWGPGPRWHHVGIYAYRRAALARYVSLPQSPLERRESLEQLRALENGMRIACVRMEHGPFGVDTQEDLERARALLGGS
jgi:3-deoxy-manno-octulosonate cytidylyltransferase (CMP-KDO synthetase)